MVWGSDDQQLLRSTYYYCYHYSCFCTTSTGTELQPAVLYVMYFGSLRRAKEWRSTTSLCYAQYPIRPALVLLYCVDFDRGSSKDWVCISSRPRALRLLHCTGGKSRQRLRHHYYAEEEEDRRLLVATTTHTHRPATAHLQCVAMMHEWLELGGGYTYSKFFCLYSLRTNWRW